MRGNSLICFVDLLDLRDTDPCLIFFVKIQKYYLKSKNGYLKSGNNYFEIEERLFEIWESLFGIVECQNLKYI